jgi:hypothetical protein
LPVLLTGLHEKEEDLFLTFLVLLLGGSVVPILIFSSSEMFGLTGQAVHRHEPGRPWKVRAALGAWSLAQGYIWLGWAAYCTSLALWHASDPAVRDPWPYYVTVLVAACVPVAYLHMQGRMSVGSDGDRERVRDETNLRRVLVFSGCLCFMIAPQLMSVPYGWSVHAAEYVSVNATAGVEGLVRTARSNVPNTQLSFRIMPRQRHERSDVWKAVTSWRADDDYDSVDAALCEAARQEEAVPLDENEVAQPCTKGD